MDKIMSKRFYISNVITDMKSEHNWTTDEIKFVLLLFSKIGENRAFIKINDISSRYRNINEVDVANIPLSYSFNRQELIKTLGFNDKNFSRNIKKVSKGLMGKYIDTPDTLNPDCKESFELISWIIKIKYEQYAGVISVSVTDDIIKRVVFFKKYTEVKFEYIAKIKNIYAITMYLFFKITLNSSKSTTREITLGLNDFKEKLYINDKYKVASSLKEYVLKPLCKEINKVTDITISYELIREGRSYTKISFNFNYKPEHINKENVSEDNKSIKSISYEENNSPFEAILVNWGIRAKKVVEIENIYSLDVIQAAIDTTLEKEKAGNIKTTKAAIFLGILENKQLASDEQFAREQLKISQQLEKDVKKTIASEYDAIQKVINDNADEISNYLSAQSINATYEISSELNEQLINMSCVDYEKFKEFRPKLPVLYNGYYDMKNKQVSSPNIYNFLLLLRTIKL